MYAPPEVADQMIRQAVALVRQNDAPLSAALDALAAPVYATDAAGTITGFNSACIDFSGRLPEVGHDRWCVTWKLYTEDGAFLPHEECPMAEAIRTAQPVRGVTALAERPDGSRVRFMPYPTPILDDAGSLVGAVNMLIDISEERQAEFFLSQAIRCERLARGGGDPQTVGTLNAMAAEYRAKAGGSDQDI